jgi:hypothetical protein
MVILKSDAAVEINGVVTVSIWGPDFVRNSTSSFISCADIIHFIAKPGVGDSAQIRTRNNSCHDYSCVMTNFGGQKRRSEEAVSGLLRVKGW